LTEQLSTFLNLFHAVDNTTAPSATDADVKAIFDSLQVEQQKDRALLTAIVPVGFIRKALAEAPTALQPPPPAPQPPPAQKKSSKRH
jgi:hypothetical protein